LLQLSQEVFLGGALNPEFCYPAGSGSEPDSNHLDPAADPNPTTGEKLLFLHHNWKKLE